MGTSKSGSIWIGHSFSGKFFYFLYSRKFLSFWFKGIIESEWNSSKKGSLKENKMEIVQLTKNGVLSFSNYTRDGLLERLHVEDIDDDFDRAMTRISVRDSDGEFSINILRFLLPLPVEGLGADFNSTSDATDRGSTSNSSKKSANAEQIRPPLFFQWFFKIAEAIGSSAELQILWTQKFEFSL